MRLAFSNMLLFVFFVLLYFLPFLIDGSAVAITEERVEQLLMELLSSPQVWFELLRNTMALLGGLFCIYLACGWVAGRLARKTGLGIFLVWLFLLLAVWLGLMAGNAWLFPRSNYSVVFHSAVGPAWGVVYFSVLLVALLVAVLPLKRGILVSLAGVLLVGLTVFGWLSAQAYETAHGAGPRNIILIGVDSLSADIFEKNPTVLPVLTKLMGQAKHYPRAYTPLGRTFPAWVSILSGKPPVEHGAIFNLRNMEHVARENLLPSTLRHQGYRTVFAIDERRFANIDEHFGFDQVVGPKVGALDFALQGVNDNPLSNVLLQTPVAAYLFPYSYINTAAHTNYSASGFVERVLDSVQGAQPLFMAVHFESAHYPYKTPHAQIELHRENRFIEKHLQALTVVDHQVEQLLAGLKAKGVLDDALVILLSDHGEAMGDVEVSIRRDGESFNVRGYGHGADLLSDRQNRIFLGRLRFQNGKPVGEPMTDLRQVSLLALRPAIEAFAEGGDVEFSGLGECLIVETGLRFDTTRDYHSLKESDVARQAASFYEIDSQGRLRLREAVLPRLLAGKDIGWRCPDRLTWYEAARQRYLAYHLDAQGLPTEQVQPDAASIARIEAYRARYLLLKE